MISGSSFFGRLELMVGFEKLSRQDRRGLDDRQTHWEGTGNESREAIPNKGVSVPHLSVVSSLPTFESPGAPVEYATALFSISLDAKGSEPCDLVSASPHGTLL